MDTENLETGAERIKNVYMIFWITRRVHRMLFSDCLSLNKRMSVITEVFPFGYKTERKRIITLLSSTAARKAEDVGSIPA
jgi:hypothetical protein